MTTNFLVLLPGTDFSWLVSKKRDLPEKKYITFKTYIHHSVTYKR